MPFSTLSCQVAGRPFPPASGGERGLVTNVSAYCSCHHSLREAGCGNMKTHEQVVIIRPPREDWLTRYLAIIISVIALLASGAANLVSLHFQSLPFRKSHDLVATVLTAQMHPFEDTNNDIGFDIELPFRSRLPSPPAQSPHLPLPLPCAYVPSRLAADVAELADALDSKSSIFTDVWVRPPPSAPCQSRTLVQ
jgi:hypothetical protein